MSPLLINNGSIELGSASTVVFKFRNNLKRQYVQYSICIMVLMITFLSGCSSYDNEPWAKYENQLMKGLALPRERGGGSYSYDVPWVSSVYKNGHISHYVPGPQYELVHVNLEAKEDGTPFLVYFDRSEHWSILLDIAKNITNKRLFYVACQISDANEPVEVESFKVEFRGPCSSSDVVYIDAFESGGLKFSGKEYPNYKDQVLVDELRELFRNDFTGSVFLRGRGDLNVELFINILAHLEGYTDMGILICTKTNS